MTNETELGLVDCIDLQIVAHLRRNARKTLTGISKETGIAISSVFDRLKRLEEIGVIRRHTSLVNLRKLGVHSAVVVLLKSEEDIKKDLEGWLRGNQHVNNLMRINGEWDFLAEAFFRDIKGVEGFMESLGDAFSGVRSSVFYVLEDTKREGSSLEVCRPEQGEGFHDDSH